MHIANRSAHIVELHWRIYGPIVFEVDEGYMAMHTREAHAPPRTVINKSDKLPEDH